MELAALGLTPEDYTAADQEPDFEVWPENWTAVRVFGALQTQWRVGFAGPVGLDYTAIEPVLRLMVIPKSQRSALFEDLQIMELEALDQMRTTAEATQRQ